MTNMTGSALTFPLYLIFLAFAQGLDLWPAEAVTLSVMATLAAVGTAAIPNRGVIITISAMIVSGVPVTSLFVLIMACDVFFDKARPLVHCPPVACVARASA